MKKTSRFSIGYLEFLWTVKVFMGFAVISFFFSTFIYMVMVVFAQPEPVNHAIATTAETAMTKVEVTAGYIPLMWSIFIHNTVAVLTACAGTGIFVYMHSLMIGELGIRKQHSTYSNISSRIERLLWPVYRLIHYTVSRFNTSVSETHREVPSTNEGSIWDLCGYTKNEYRTFSWIMPYTVPVLIIMVNGILIGILLAFVNFNSALIAYQLMGNPGIIIGILYSWVYFTVSVLPHGIIEIPVILVSAALGYRFARIQSGMITDNELFTGDNVDELKNDVEKINSVTREYLSSRYLWQFLLISIILLLIAAYIEVNITPVIMERSMQAIEGFML
ncbi:protein of unknown function DUF95 transmembrane [Methanosalsum zhilinae DSM 4017]|uniref:Stage II sporulation protein M n=1 Tax=Methanosalsum zhilinae (strain DSM 4017 / NBRC 107636 / OCM 62 / WeN5) TaxID=679901 RepID=F7XMH1_METZD|nr:stage II sporulation protein M [Methanosalsum zhilinae]AEH59894.1 protein of unknown function DUF95 transmembrane [Methanosalsum zhilinae DSM 4017]